ncbi:MAG: hypothetical protein AAF329_22685, partial [Cyanobacteria bacterium P01_A01_bin.17]
HSDYHCLNAWIQFCNTTVISRDLQGLGIALTGGLALSTFLTPTVIPALMGLLQDFSPKREIEKPQQQDSQVDEREYQSIGK